MKQLLFPMISHNHISNENQVTDAMNKSNYNT